MRFKCSLIKINDKMEWLVYLFKVSACLALFYAFYYFFLQQLTFFNTNRYYLLATLIISSAIPSLELQIQGAAGERKDFQTEVGINSNSDELGQSNFRNAAPKIAKSEVDDDAFPWQQRIVQAYWLIAAAVFARFLFQVLRILWYAGLIDQKMGRLKLVYKDKGFTNCSFFNYVFIDRKGMTDDEIAQILKHECVHASYLHSVDKLISGLFKCILWFNPLIYLYDDALEQVHEYEADRQTSTSTGNTSYASFLLAIAVRNNPVLVHSFVKGPIKKRITMLFNDQSKSVRKLNYLAALPLAMALAWSFGVQVIHANPNETGEIQLEGSVQKNDFSLETSPSGSMLKKDMVIPQRSPSDTLRMVDYSGLGENPVVIIDGKRYEADILYRISPRCISYQNSLDGKLVLTTNNNKIEYATDIDKQNKRTRNRANSLAKFYVRYALKNPDGSRYDEILLKDKKGSGGTVYLKKGSKLLFIIDGKQVREEDLGSISIDEFRDWNLNLASGIKLTGDLATKYGNGYNAMARLSKRNLDSIETKISDSKSPLTDDASKQLVTYSARDSTVVDEANQTVTLYGKASKIIFGYYIITADQITFNAKELKGIARNAATVFNSGQNAQSGISDSVHFDFRSNIVKCYGIK
jgi:hypothetical protein